MFSNLLIKIFIKKSNDVENLRDSYGYLAGFVGIISNILLFIIKLTVGILVNSIAIIADAFNNLSDAASSIVTIVGFKLSKRPADKEHPFGHGRIEYLSALIVAFMVMMVGFQFIKTSFERIMHPESITFEIIPFILLLLSILVKLWLSRFNKIIGEKINSSALKAASVDALGDVFTSSCVVISFLATKFTTIPIDGYIGVLVSLIILYSGFTLVKETMSPLIGEAPDPYLVTSITTGVLSYDNIIGVHDLIIHNYGVGKCMASIHAEIPSNIDIMKIHEIIDKAERELSEKLNIYLVIHMDPICIDSKEVNDALTMVQKIIKFNSLTKSVHDFRIVGEGNKKNLIFDVVVDSANLTITEEELKSQLISEVRKLHPEYNCIITIDNDFI
ncbi:cation diffusion facilitator family transporter [Clostridium cavendishii DSM 21758]|uniref:Cation diffusion facilitator family transporter n=1 Tax=Clostridium cavendishii DSM 21758 TaxID=1121302 RepID=A0A1M6QJ39_9CLOT|nr:cation diffusion facilitator family transporter [Clostridium cavendishii]SHK20324.1 cation diffusion facilitator family transporter [Clostridium cavendishii DSM 21758]